MLSATRRDSYVLSQDWWPLFRRYRNKVNAASKSLANSGVTMRRLNIFHPIRIDAEHGYEIAVSVHSDNNHRVRARTPGRAPLNFEDSLEPWWQSEARPPRRKAVDPAAK